MAYNIADVAFERNCKQGRQNSGRAGGAVQELRAMEACKNQTNRYQLCLFLRSNNVDLTNNSRNYRRPF